MTKIDFGLKIGDVCKVKNNDSIYAFYAKIREIGYFGKTYKIARCEWTQSNPTKIDTLFGMIKYFKLSDLKKCD